MDDPKDDNKASESEVELESLELIYDTVKASIDAQNAQISSYDTKAGFVLGSASLLTAGAVGFQKTAFDVASNLAQKQLLLDPWVKPTMVLLTIAAMAFYLAIVIAGYNAYRIRKFQILADLDVLTAEYLDKRPDTTKLVLLDTFRTIYNNNEPKVKAKGRATEWAIRFLICEALFIAALTAVQVFVFVQDIK